MYIDEEDVGAAVVVLVLWHGHIQLCSNVLFISYVVCAFVLFHTHWKLAVNLHPPSEDLCLR